MQLELFERPAFSPIRPPRETMAAEALAMLLQGREITHLDFQLTTSSWRLAAYVHVLRLLGWPIITIEILSPTPDCPLRFIAKYAIPTSVIDELGEVM